jgi:DNA-directed RNA polymerase alpha subunit
MMSKTQTCWAIVQKGRINTDWMGSNRAKLIQRFNEGWPEPNAWEAARKEYGVEIRRIILTIASPKPQWLLSDDTPLVDAGLTTRSYSVLCYHAVTVGDVRKLNDAELLRLPNFGRKSLNEVKRLIFALEAGKP